jgi:hypothetical protein
MFRFPETRTIIQNLFNRDASNSRQELTDATNLATESVERTSNRYEDGFGNFPTSSRNDDVQNKILGLPAQIVGASISGTINTAFLLYSKSIMLDFSYLKEPTFRAASSSLGGYYSVLINTFAEKERINLQYKSMQISGIQNIVTGYSLPAIFSLLTSRNVARTFASRTITGFIARATIGTLARFGVLRTVRAFLVRAGARAAFLQTLGSFVPGAGNLAAAIATVIIESFLLGLAFLKFTDDEKKREELNNYVSSKMFLDLINPQKIIPFYKQNLPLLMEFEGLDYSKLIGTDENSLASSVYSLANVNLKNLGISVQEISELATRLSVQTPVDTNQLALLTSKTLDYSLLFTDGNFNSISSVMSSIISATQFSSQDVNLAIEAFEDFFFRMVGEGAPQGAYFRLIQSLAEFSNSYGAIEKLSGASPIEISKINQFMSDNGRINGRFDVSATQDVIKTADDIILRGAISADAASRTVFLNAGISVEEAIRGVTSSAEVFTKFLDGMIQTMGITRDEIPTGEILQNSKYSNQLRNASYILGMSGRQIQVLNHALQRYAMGHDITSILGEYDESSKNKVSLESNLDKFIRIINEQPQFEVLSNLTESNNKLVQATNMYAEQIVLLQTAVQRLTLGNFEKYSAAVVLKVGELFGLVNPVILSASEQRRASRDTSTTTRNRPSDRTSSVDSSSSASSKRRASRSNRATNDNTIEPPPTPSPAPLPSSSTNSNITVTNASDLYLINNNLNPETSSTIMSIRYAKSLELITAYESSEYTALLRYSNRPGRHFEDVDITKMTLGEVIEFAQARGEGTYRDWSIENMPEGTAAYAHNEKVRANLQAIEDKRKEKGITQEEIDDFIKTFKPEDLQFLASTPMGRYQFVGTTLKSIATRENIDLERIFNEELQDELFILYSGYRLSLVKESLSQTAINEALKLKNQELTNEEVNAIIESIEGDFNSRINMLIGGWEGLGKEREKNGLRNLILMVLELLNIEEPKVIPEEGTQAMLFPRNNLNTISLSSNNNITNMTIKIPIVSNNPYSFVTKFAEAMIRNV